MWVVEVEVRTVESTKSVHAPGEIIRTRENIVFAETAQDRAKGIAEALERAMEWAGIATKNRFH